MQAFRQAEYSHGRPSAVDYDAASSGGTNLAPTNRELVDAVDERVGVIAEETGRPDVCRGASLQTSVNARVATRLNYQPHC
ncbi:hypothetical protein CO661_31120 [Sinorhizobium fredii]|uniref:Uncharacterized protein n=1 Tax=Rhizobium fredii TaxID=380 RepID=A0A2A6LP76_RHIFR|nr:hypothetical protein CO661_31120 [Sinorhizobium fredii]